jgi:hypothetical protein
MSSVWGLQGECNWPIANVTFDADDADEIVLASACGGVY